MFARYIYSIILITVFSLSGSAQIEYISDPISPESLAIHVVNESSVLIIHNVLPKQTLYSIARFYGTTVQEIYKINEQIIGRSIHPGEKLIIKIPKSSIKHIQPESNITSYIKMVYQVQLKETLYGIAKRSFHTDIEYLTEINSLSENILSPGQYLIIGWMNSNGVSPIAQAMERANELENETIDSTFITTLEENLINHTDVQNIAYWHKNQDNTSDLYVLHKNARVNSFIEIKNPMFDTSVKAKVIGHLPSNTYPEDIDLIVSSKVANQLGVIDARFYVEVSYLE